MNRPRHSGPLWAFAAAVIGLGILHHDIWYWDDRTLVLGVVPIGLAYHIGFSMAAATLWALVVRFAWPDRIEQWADEPCDEEVP